MHDLGPGWPGNFPAHHVRTHFVKKSAKRETNTQNMVQAPHKSCIQPNNESKNSQSVDRNSPKRSKLNVHKLCSNIAAATCQQELSKKKTNKQRITHQISPRPGTMSTKHKQKQTRANNSAKLTQTGKIGNNNF